MIGLVIFNKLGMNNVIYLLKNIVYWSSKLEINLPKYRRKKKLFRTFFCNLNIDLKIALFFSATSLSYISLKEKKKKKTNSVAADFF